MRGSPRALLATLSTSVISRGVSIPCGLSSDWIESDTDPGGSGGMMAWPAGGEGGDKEGTRWGRRVGLGWSQLSHSGGKEGRRKARNKDRAAERESGRAGSPTSSSSTSGHLHQTFPGLVPVPPLAPAAAPSCLHQTVHWAWSQLAPDKDQTWETGILHQQRLSGSFSFSAVPS